MEPGSVPALGIENRTLNEQVYDVLLRSIVDRHIKPGERLLLEALAAQLRVSRTPVRDALSRLAAEGLIEPHEGRGFRVTVLRAEDLRHIFDLRLMCERYAVAKGMGSLTGDLLSRMEETAAECARLHGSPEPADRLASYRKDEQFHCLIVGLAGNPRLVAFYRHLNISVQALRVGPSSLTPQEAQAFTVAEHAAILSALRERDPERAEAAVEAHITAALARALRSLALSHRERGQALIARQLG